MANIFTLENLEDFSEKLNMDDLYEKKRQFDLSKLSLFNKILNRIHVKIKTTSRQKIDEQFCWYLIPEIIIGVPKYDQGACIAYLMDKLTENGFHVRYIDPNVIFISWKHFVPSYVRTEFKKKTGIEINEYGEKIDKNQGLEITNIIDKKNSNELMFKIPISKGNQESIQIKKQYTPINSYKPSGNLIYNDDYLHKLEDKLL